MQNHMKECRNEGVPFLTFPELSELPQFHHAFSTRLGGISKGYLASMNLGFGRGDDEKTVLQNYQIFCHATGFPIESLVLTAQDHHTNIRRVGRKDRGAGILFPKPWQSVDGLITNDPGVTLCVFGADCVPILIVDPISHAIGVCHAGWRGTVGKIAAKTVFSMQREFGSLPQNLQAFIGPSIGPCCFEVDEPVEREFAALKTLGPETLIEKKPNGKYYIDLWETNARILKEAGVLKVTIGGLCTKCHPELVWSHRASGGKRGGMCGMLMIREEKER